MKKITNNADRPLPLPDGRSLKPGESTVIPDHVAAGDRVQGWSTAVTIVDHVLPELVAEPVPAVDEAEPAMGDLETTARRRSPRE